MTWIIHVPPANSFAHEIRNVCENNLFFFFEVTGTLKVIVCLFVCFALQCNLPGPDGTVFDIFS